MSQSALQQFMSAKSEAGTPWTTEEAKTELLKLAIEGSGSTAPTVLTPAANVKFGLTVGGAITHALPASPAAGDKAKYYIKPTGDRTLDFDTAILKPTDSGLTLPKTMTSAKTYVVLMEYNGTAWMLVSLVGGY